MTTGTAQSQAIHVANSMLGVAAQIMNIYDQINLLDQQWNDQQVAATLDTFATVSTTADGGVGDSDPAPVSGNMIDLAIYTGLSRSVSALEINQIKGALDDLRHYIDGLVVPANPGARSILNTATGG
jgi:hypothetical protein